MKLHWILGDQLFSIHSSSVHGEQELVSTRKRGLYLATDQETIKLNVAASLSNVWRCFITDSGKQLQIPTTTDRDTAVLSCH